MAEPNHAVGVNIYLLLLPFVGIIKHRSEWASEYACERASIDRRTADVLIWVFYVRI